jgi:hypothetical protein
MELIMSNPLITVLIVLVLAVVGKYLFISKDKEKDIINDINNISEKEDKKIDKIKSDFTDDIHALELKILEQFGRQSEKMRIIQKEVADEADKKFFTKEMAEKHNERISKMEEVINAMLPRLEKLDIVYDIITKKGE